MQIRAFLLDFCLVLRVGKGFDKLKELVYNTHELKKLKKYDKRTIKKY